MFHKSTRNRLISFFNISLIQPLFDLFFPALCFICGRRLEKNRKIICASCFHQIPRSDPSAAEVLASVREFNTAFILFDFNETVRLLIHLFKYKGYLSLAEYFAEAVAETFPCLLSNHYDFIMPVPLHQTRQRERGFNQSAVLGAALGKKLNLPLLENILTRQRNTLSQTHLNKSQRMQNVNGAFICRDIPSAARILIIDDVITTASTINACCHTLRKAGAAAIDALALAHPLEDGFAPRFKLAKHG
jgi:ComF family protein